MYFDAVFKYCPALNLGGIKIKFPGLNFPGRNFSMETSLTFLPYELDGNYVEK